MQDQQSIHFKLKILGIEAPSWPRETFSTNNEVSDWIKTGFEIATVLEQWQKLSKEASAVAKTTLKFVFESSIASKNINPLEEMLWVIIESIINKTEAKSLQKSCNRKIKDFHLSHAQLLGIGIHQAKSNHYESAKTALEKLSKGGKIDEVLSHRLQRIILTNSLEYMSLKNTQSESWEEKVRQFKADLISTRRVSNQIGSVSKNSSKYYWENLRTLLQEKANPVILVAGMRHSGSTALFNIIRLGIKYSLKTHFAKYSEYVEPKSIKCEPGLVNIIKIHDYRNDYYSLADIIITSRRDLRDTIASAKRRNFGMMKALGGEVVYARFNRRLHETWHQSSDYEMPYDNFMEDPISEIRKIFDIIGVDSELAPFVFAELKVLPTNKYDETLLSETHITDPERVHSYGDTLEQDVIRRINEENDDWLKKFGY